MESWGKRESISTSTYDWFLEHHDNRLKHILLALGLPGNGVLIVFSMHRPILGLKADLCGFTLEQDGLAGFRDDENSDTTKHCCNDEYDPYCPAPSEPGLLDQEAACDRSECCAYEDGGEIEVNGWTSVGSREEVYSHCWKDGNDGGSGETGEKAANEDRREVLRQGNGKLEDDEERET